MIGSGPSTTPPPHGAQGMVELMGGTRGMVEATIPGVVFAVAYPVSGARLGPSLWIALLSALVLGVLALWHRRPIGQVVASLVGVGIMAGWAAWRGQPQDFYFPSIVKNSVYASVYAISCLVRWPLLGLILGPILGEGVAWRRDPTRYRAYWLASWLWAGVFLVRLLVQIPLYLAERTTILGFANIPLGLPLFLLACGGTWLILRSSHPVHPEKADESEAHSGPDGTEESGVESQSSATEDEARRSVEQFE